MELSLEVLDIIKELFNLGVGKGADVLNTMLKSPIVLQVPNLRVLTMPELHKELGGNKEIGHSSVNMKFNGIVSGTANLIFPSKNVPLLVSALSGEKSDAGTEVDPIKAGTLVEVGNIVLNSVIGSISNFLNLKLSFSVPNYFAGTYQQLIPKIQNDDTSVVLLAETSYMVEKLKISGEIIIFFKMVSFDELINAVHSYQNRLI